MIGSEKFIGNCYIFIPCHYKSNVIFPKQKIECDKNKSYLDSFNEYFPIEVNTKIYKDIERIFLGKVDLFYLDNLEELKYSNKTVSVNIFLTYHKKTNLAVISIAIFNANIPITHLLDRISQNNIRIKMNNEDILFEDYLKKYNLIKLDSGKVCLSVDNSIDKDIFPYYFANETYESSLMSTKLKEEIFGQHKFENIAQYCSSDLYVGISTVLRIDNRDYKNDNTNRIKSDIIFLFILEVLMLKDASIERTNQKLVQYISNNENISVNHLSKLISEFSKTMPFWDINVFTYITSQNLANKIEKTFQIENKYTSYLKNQKFLQYKINLNQAIEQENENNLLFYIAIIVFSFELYNVFKDFIASKPISFSLASIIFFLLLLFKYKKGQDQSNED